MKPSSAQQDALVQFLARIYSDICQVETDLNLLVGDNDFRPRIEYFHDAVRAFTSGNPAEREIGGRLSIEWLAYDLECLRYIQSKPLAILAKHNAALSPQKTLVEVTPNALAMSPKHADRATRDRIIDLYQHYSLMFAALLKPFADRDYQERVDTLNNDVRDIHTLLDQFDHGALNAALATVQDLEDESLRAELLDFLQKQKQKKSDALKAMLADLKKTAKQKDTEIAAVEKAHMQFGLAQLALYENGKDILKKMATSGMNLVGTFVENVMSQTRREMGR